MEDLKPEAGKKGKPKWLLYSAVIILFAIGFGLEFLPETLAIWWHLRNGRTASIAGYRIPVGGLSSASYCDSGLRPPYNKTRESLMLMTVPGRFRQLFQGNSMGAFIFFSTPSLTVAEVRRTNEGSDETAPMDRAESEITMAGTRHTCFESQNTEPSDWVAIHCVPREKGEGMDILFTGHQNFTSEFLDTLRRITKNKD